MIKITYLIDNDDWSDEDFQNNSEQELVLTKDMVIDYINRFVTLEKDCYLDDILHVERI